jgi:DNA mismatch repair ATPase MutS
MDSLPVRDDPSAEYSSRLQHQRGRQSFHERRHQQLGIAKLAVAFAALIALVWVLKSQAASIVWLLAPVFVFVLLDAAHVRALRSLKRCSRIIAFYERGLARLDNRWMGAAEPGDRFLDPSHPYARDLDLFGKASLFELLCTARTCAGQEILARWLLRPASLEEIASRHAAITDLRSRLNLREELSAFGEDIHSRVRPDAIAAWAETPPSWKPMSTQVVAIILAALWISCLAAWAIWGRWELAFASSVVNLFFNSRFHTRVRSIIPAEAFAPDLELLAAVLARFESDSFSSAKLVNLQAALREQGVPPSLSIGKIRRLLESLESRRNILVAAIDPFVFWTAQIALAVERWRRKFGPAIRRWLAAVGEMEALTALAGYAYEHPADVFPEFADDGAVFQAEGLAHPLLPERQAVRNDLSIGGELRLLIISGPNMAGKSTFVRAVGINAVLAQCGAPVRARRLRLSLLQVSASICILDSLQGGVSRFYAEISRLKLIAGLAAGPLPVLFLLDELLSGTNSNDRRIGAEAVVKNLVAQGAVGLVTTHDLALTLMVDDLKPQAANFHFEDHLENGELRFDYRLVLGIAKTSNALKLMRSIGLEV